VIAAPPVDTGAVHDTTDVPVASAEVTVVPDTAVGAPGTVAGTAAEDAVEAVPVPAEFVAVTVNVYEVPFVRPETVQEVVALRQVNDPGLEVTV